MPLNINLMVHEFETVLIECKKINNFILYLFIYLSRAKVENYLLYF